MATTDCCSIHVGDHIIFTPTVQDCDGNAVNISGASLVEFTFERPNGSTMVGTGTLVSFGLGGKVKFITPSGFLDSKGQWKLQAYVIDSGNREYNTSIYRFRVKDNL